MKALLVNDTTDWYHFGCTGTSIAIKSELNRAGYEVVSLSIICCNSILFPPQDIHDFFKKDILNKFIKKNSELSNMISGSDIVIVNGEGTLHGVKQGPLKLLFIIYLAKAVFKKHVEIINHSVYPQDNLSLDNMHIINLYKKIYSIMNYVAIREPVSLSLMENIGIYAEESFDCLPLYIRDYYDIKRIKKNSKDIVVSGSAAWFDLNIFTNKARASSVAMMGLDLVLEVLLQKVQDGYSINFLYSNIEHPAEDDKNMIEYINDKHAGACMVVSVESTKEWLDCIANADMVVSGRFHHTIAACCLGTRSIVLNSNTPKINGLTKSLGLPPPINFADTELKDKIICQMNDCQPLNMLRDSCLKAENNFKLSRQIVCK